MQALMLAAGFGKRLGKYTNNNTKCMVEVAGEKLIDRAIDAVILAGIKKMIIVVGYKGENLINYINEKYKDKEIEFVFIKNDIYDKTNNIYSFYLAKDYIEQDDTILMESDLIFEKNLIKELVNLEYPNIAVIAKYKSWMDGTIVTCNKDFFITNFLDKFDMDLFNTSNYYKTVNIYKFSKEFCKDVYVPFLEAYMKSYGLNNYYETVLKVVPFFSINALYGFEIGKTKWYEIDDAQDLDISNFLFSSGSTKSDLITAKLGGNWRYESVDDFCCPSNPFFPTKNMIQKMQAGFSKLIISNPSGLEIQKINTERIFGVDQNYVLVGNGASELINVLGRVVKGKIAVNSSSMFNTYIKNFKNVEIVKIDDSKFNYNHNINEYKKICKEVDYLCIVNPDNPSGALLTKAEIEEILVEANKYKAKVIIDESFIDFSDEDKKYTLLENSCLEKYSNLILIKSLGKSFGITGLRLGVLATSDRELINLIKSNMPIWNINSLAEYFMQIFLIFNKSYINSCKLVAEERKRVIEELNNIPNIKVYNSQTSFIMIDLGDTSSYKLCVEALCYYNVLIKDLSSQESFKDKNFVRISIRNKEKNDKLIQMLKELLIK